MGRNAISSHCVLRIFSLAASVALPDHTGMGQPRGLTRMTGQDGETSSMARTEAEFISEQPCGRGTVGKIVAQRLASHLSNC